VKALVSYVFSQGRAALAGRAADLGSLPIRIRLPTGVVFSGDQKVVSPQTGQRPRSVLLPGFGRAFLRSDILVGLGEVTRTRVRLTSVLAVGLRWQLGNVTLTKCEILGVDQRTVSYHVVKAFNRTEIQPPPR
jgi:hypothetical protein